MKKNKILLIIAIIFLFLLASIFIAYLQHKKQTKYNDPYEKEISYPSARESGVWGTENIKKIKIEIASDEERAKMGLSNSRLADPADIQILGRDQDGKVTSYRKIYKPEDIVEFVNDPTGELTGTMAEGTLRELLKID